MHAQPCTMRAVKVAGGLVVYGIGVGVGSLVYQTQSFDGAGTSDRERRATWDRLAGGYDAMIAPSEHSIGMDDLRHSLLQRASGTVLELCAGTARNLQFYPPGRCAAITLTDQSPAMVEVARSKAAQTVPALAANPTPDHDGAGAPPPPPTTAAMRVDCQCEDAEALSFADASFDTVVDTFGLCSANDPARVLAEAARVCKPEGQVLLLEHGQTRWPILSSYLAWRAPLHAREWGCWWDRDILGLIAASGLVVEECEMRHCGTTFVVVARKTAGHTGAPPPA